MRIAFVPCVTHTSWSTESEITQFRRFARTVWEHDGVVSYLLIPSNMLDDSKVEDEPPYLFNIKTGLWQKFHVAMGNMPKGFDQLVNTGLPKLYADMVVTTRTGAAGYMQRQLWDGKQTILPVFIQEQMAADYSTPVVTMIDDIDLMARSMSYAVCRPLFATDLEKKSAVTACRRFLTASVCRKIAAKSPVFPHGISFEAVDKVQKKLKGKKNRSFTVFFGGRLNALKRANQLMATYDKFYASGRPIRIIITSPLPSMPKKAPREIELKDSLNTEQFLKECCKAHVLLASSRIEGFTAGLHEMMATGMVTILPDLEWAKVLLKEKWADYPFKYKTFAEAYALLTVVYDDYEGARKKVAWMPQWLRDNVREQDCSIKIYEWMKEQLVPWPPVKMGKAMAPNGNGQLVERLLKKMPAKGVFLLKDLMAAIVEDDGNQYSDRDWHLGARGKFSAWQLYSYLSGHPKLVDVGGTQPRFRKKGRK